MAKLFLFVSSNGELGIHHAFSHEQEDQFFAQATDEGLVIVGQHEIRPDPLIEKIVFG